MTQPAPGLTLELDGAFYPTFIKDKNYSTEALQAIKETVAKLLEQPTSVNKPGMLLGKVQSGKTKTFMGIMALAFDNGFDVCVVLTKGTMPLMTCSPKHTRPSEFSRAWSSGITRAVRRNLKLRSS